MQLFGLQASDKLLNEYLQENYISMSLPWLEQDVEHIEWQQLCEQYARAEHCAELRLFAYEMQDGDFVIATDGERAYLGDLGDYYFVEEALDKQVLDKEAISDSLPARNHRRGVTWLKPILLETIQASAQLEALLDDSNALVKLLEIESPEKLEIMLNSWQAVGSAQFSQLSQPDQSTLVDEQTIKEAVDVLKQALRSEDAERRERAAIALLAFATNNERD